MIFPDAGDRGTLLVPNAAVLIARSPNPANGQRFIDFLMTAAVEQSLAEGEAAQMPLRPGVPVPAGMKRIDEVRTMPVNYEKLGARLERLVADYLAGWARQK
jgi:iron(III) transport system substrate-binding protein